jgi:hypothetical protein
MSKRILVVEDQPDSRRIIRDMLAPTDDPALRSITIIAVTSYELDGEEKTARAARL